MEMTWNEDKWLEMKRAGTKDMKVTAYCMAMIPNGRAWKEMEEMIGNERKWKEMKGKWQETKGNVRKLITIARKYRKWTELQGN